MSGDFHQSVGEPFWLIEHYDVVGVCVQSVPGGVALALRQGLIEIGIRVFGGTDICLFRHPLTRTRKRDRLRIRSYRLRRQLRVDIVPVLLIDEDRRQLGGGMGNPGSPFSIEFRKALRKPSLVKSIGF
jgi:hypothetical protein